MLREMNLFHVFFVKVFSGVPLFVRYDHMVKWFGQKEGWCFGNENLKNKCFVSHLQFHPPPKYGGGQFPRTSKINWGSSLETRGAVQICVERLMFQTWHVYCLSMAKEYHNPLDIVPPYTSIYVHRWWIGAAKFETQTDVTAVKGKSG